MKKILILLIIISTVLALMQCAQVGSPTGGKKDTIPPRFVKSIPEMRQTNFNGDRVTITFDEYIDLKNINRDFLVSPPLKNKPDIRLRGRSVVVKMSDTLKENTTYTLDFANCITDLNENNIFKNFQFSFATGEKIDTLRMSGQVVNAFSHKPEEGVFVFAYKNFTDSTPIKKLPDYLTRTDKEGKFSLNNVAQNRYRIFALKDGNNNMLFDLPNEAIAFNDTVYDPQARNAVRIDTVKIRKGTIKKDSTFPTKYTLFTPNNLKLYLFKENNLKQFLKTSTRKETAKCQFIFNAPLTGNYQFKPLNFIATAKNLIVEKTKTNDTITYWLTDSLQYKKDTILFSTTYEKLDSLGKTINKTDTVKFIYAQTVENKKPSKTPQVKPRLEKCKVNVSASALMNLNVPIVFDFSKPIHSYDVSKIHLYEFEDKKMIPVKFTFAQDTFHIRQYRLNVQWKENTTYKLKADSLTFIDLFNKSIDSVSVKFTTQKLNFYGTIKVNLKTVTGKGNIIVQLLRDKETVVQEIIADKNNVVQFNYLSPNKYMIRAILDDNKNKIWDTGKYIKDLQPETVLYYKDEITVKSNWDNEIDW